MVVLIRGDLPGCRFCCGVAAPTARTAIRTNMSPHDAILLQNGDILVAEWLPIGRITLLRHVS